MGCKYVKEFKFDSGAGFTGSSGKKEVKAYMRGGPVRKAPLDAAAPKQTPNNMRPLRTANAKTAMKEGNEKNVAGASGKIKTAGQYAKGGMACGYKKGGKTAKKAPAKKAAARRKDKASDAMAEQVLAQMLSQASQTGSMPGVPMEMPMQGRPMPAPGARAVPVASQAPMLPMKSGGMSKGQQAKMGRVMDEYKSGKLHSGSKSGPMVKSRDQAVAIAMSEARKKRA